MIGCCGDVLNLLETEISLCILRNKFSAAVLKYSFGCAKLLYNFLANKPPNEVSIVPCYCLSHGPASAEVDPSYDVLFVLIVAWHWTNNINDPLFVRRTVITRNY